MNEFPKLTDEERSLAVERLTFAKFFGRSGSRAVQAAGMLAGREWALRRAEPWHLERLSELENARAGRSGSWGTTFQWPDSEFQGDVREHAAFYFLEHIREVEEVDRGDALRFWAEAGADGLPTWEFVQAFAEAAFEVWADVDYHVDRELTRLYESGYPPLTEQPKGRS